MQPRSYLVYDVFTDTPLAGNPLAIVTAASGLDDAAMQAIAREFNLSETVFLHPAANPLHRARLRIFTPDHELPFAGHPTVGTAVALAEQAGGEASAGVFVLEETIGPVRCIATLGEGAGFAEFDLPRLAEKLPLAVEPSALAAALGLGPQDIGFENHRPSQWSAGVPFVMVPVSGLDAAARIRFDSHAWGEFAPRGAAGIAASAYVYCRDTIDHGCDFHARMFWGGNPSFEDPATGSAAAAFSGAIQHFDRPIDGPQRFWIEQGVEMGRPSRIRLEIDVEAGRIARARIGGHAVKVAEGTLHA